MIEGKKEYKKSVLVCQTEISKNCLFTNVLKECIRKKKTVYSAMYSTYSQYYKSSFITLQPSIQCVRNRKRERKNRKIM